MKISNFLIFLIIAATIFYIGTTSPKNQYKDAEDLATKVNTMIQSRKYLSYEMDYSPLQEDVSVLKMKVYSKENQYRVEISKRYIVLAQKTEDPFKGATFTGKMFDTETNDITTDIQDNTEVYNAVQSINIVEYMTYANTFTNKYVKLQNTEKIGGIECKHAFLSVHPAMPKFDFCYDYKYGVSIKTKMLLTDTPLVTITLSNISDEKFDDALLKEF